MLVREYLLQRLTRFDRDGRAVAFLDAAFVQRHVVGMQLAAIDSKIRGRVSGSVGLIQADA